MVDEKTCYKDRTFEIMIHGQSDSNYVKNPENWSCISCMRFFLEGCHIMFKSSTQKYVCVSVTEAKLSAGVTCVHYMLCKCYNNWSSRWHCLCC